MTSAETLIFLLFLLPWATFKREMAQVEQRNCGWPFPGTVQSWLVILLQNLYKKTCFLSNMGLSNVGLRVLIKMKSGKE